MKHFNNNNNTDDDTYDDKIGGKISDTNDTQQIRKYSN